MLTDDGTGLPEWLYAEVDEATVIVPLVDATEAGEHVQVAVSRSKVGDAPRPAGDTQHLSQGEEAALYRHYGIEYSRAASETVLPTDVPPPDAPVGTPEAVADQPDRADVARRGPGVAAVLAVLAGVGVLVAGVLRLRRRRSQPQPGLTVRRARDGAAAAGRVAAAAASSARAASVEATARTREMVAAAAPLVAAIGGLVWRGTRAGAASALHAASAIRLGGAVETVPEVVSETGKRLRKGRKKLMGRLSLGLGFGVGYVVGARAGRARFEQIKRAASSFAERPEVQQALDKVKDAAPAALQARIGAMSQRTSGATSDVGRPAGEDTVTVLPPVVDADPVIGASGDVVPPPAPSDGPDGPP
ncbi:hypothetical protein [Geodermatophilus sp. URMC 64]